MGTSSEHHSRHPPTDQSLSTGSEHQKGQQPPRRRMGRRHSIGDTPPCGSLQTGGQTMVSFSAIMNHFTTHVKQLEDNHTKELQKLQEKLYTISRSPLKI